MLNVVILRVNFRLIMLNMAIKPITLSVIMLSVIKSSIIMSVNTLSASMLSVVILSAVLPFSRQFNQGTPSQVEDLVHSTSLLSWPVL